MLDMSPWNLVKVFFGCGVLQIRIILIGRD